MAGLGPRGKPVELPDAGRAQQLTHWWPEEEKEQGKQPRYATCLRLLLAASQSASSRAIKSLPNVWRLRPKTANAT